MEREDLLALLRAQKAADPEAGHMVADQALLEYIDDAEIRQAFEAITKWYA